MSILQRIKALLLTVQREPAVVLLGVNSAVAIATTWGLSLSPEQTGAILVGTTAVLSLLTALLARPVSIVVVKGAVISLLTATEAFHLHLSQPKIAGTVVTLSVILGLLFRQNVTPVASSPEPRP